MALEERGLVEVETHESERLRQDAEKYLRASVDRLSQLHDRFELAVSQRALASFLVKRVSSLPDLSESLQEIRELLDAAEVTFAGLGAELELQKTQRLLQWLSMKEDTTPHGTSRHDSGVN